MLGVLMPRERGIWAGERDQLAEASAQFSFANMKALAQRALDAARSAGAEFADVRLNAEQYLRYSLVTRDAGVESLVRITATAGVRAAVGGAWGFSGGYDLSPENLASVARLAVARARAGRSGRSASFDFAPAPVVRDSAGSPMWQTPIDVDPFTVAPAEQRAFLLDAIGDALRVKGAPYLVGHLRWLKSERVFASSEGSMISQRIYSAYPSAKASTTPADDHTVECEAFVDTLGRGGYGFEAVLRANLREEWRRAAEEAVRLAALPRRSVEVGRYDLVLSPEVVAAGVRDSIGRALELDRALGHKANGAGTSYAAPPMEILGKYQLGSQLLTVTGDRSRPHANATVGWDEEGVEPDEFDLVRDGVITDYVTTRRTAPAIRQWYSRRGLPFRSHGCAARTGARQPILQLPNLTIAPGKDAISVEALIKDVKKGYYVLDGRYSVDQQCLNVQCSVGKAFEIKNGRLGEMATDLAFQFSTPQFWKSLDGLGGPRSAVLVNTTVDYEQSDHLIHIGVQSVPARFRKVNVVNTGKQA